jgi:hypothetical protein
MKVIKLSDVPVGIRPIGFAGHARNFQVLIAWLADIAALIRATVAIEIRRRRLVDLFQSQNLHHR